MMTNLSYELRNGQKELNGGQADLRNGQKVLSDGQADLLDVVNKLRDGQAELHNNLNKLRNETKEGFISSHNFFRDRIKVIKSSSDIMRFKNFNCSGQGTRHAFYLKGRYGQFFSPHFDCLNPDQMEKDLKGIVVTHAHYDLGIILQCPEESSRITTAIDISHYTSPHLGDPVASFGFGFHAKAWTGSIAQEQMHGGEPVNITHWRNDTNKLGFGEIMAQSFQHKGMSGGAVSNGCGYLGMAHLIEMSDGFANYVYITPAAINIKFAYDNFDKLPKKCKNLKPVKLALSGSDNCIIKSVRETIGTTCQTK